MLEEYFTYEKILFYICRIRAKQAKLRCKRHLIHLLSVDENTNYHINHKQNSKHLDSEQKKLNSILPPRKKWKKLNREKRYINNFQKIDSIEYNTLSLIETVKYYKRQNPSVSFIKELDDFIKKIQDSINDSNYKITSPTIIPKLKDKLRHEGENKCRPISTFTLEDRIIISLVNKYLTDFFDEYFYLHSYAFRAKREIKGKKILTMHHEAIDSIFDFRNNYKGKRLYVSECDISKFYDSVNHTIVKKCFNDLLKKSNKEFDVRAKNLFYKYLDCYSFVHDVLKLNDNIKYKDFWNERGIDNGKFGWIEDELANSNYYKAIRRNRIGVPQGGAISGFIANLVLHKADMNVIKYNDKRLHYVRFCDDMVILHSNKCECKKYYEIYQKSLVKLKLIPHPHNSFNSKFDNVEAYRSFWSDSIKSKAAYKWSKLSAKSTFWIGFVGYEISYDNELRVRKRSLKKEKQKQKELIDTTLKSLQKGKRKSDETIIESVYNRIIGMSVGRITIKSYEQVENDFCWIKGFNRLQKNIILEKQLKGLDNYRNRQIYRLKKHLKKFPVKVPTQDLYIPKHIFTCIPEISPSKSEEIREALVCIKILTGTYKLSEDRRQEIQKTDFKIDLPSEFLHKTNLILLVLLEYRKKDRNVNYYGKPFSYYYNVIEKRK